MSEPQDTKPAVMTAPTDGAKSKKAPAASTAPAASDGKDVQISPASGNEPDPILAEILGRLRKAEAESSLLKARLAEIEAKQPAPKPTAPVKPLAPGHLRVRFNAVEPAVDARHILPGPHAPGLQSRVVFSQDHGFDQDVPEAVAKRLCDPKRVIVHKDKRGIRTERQEFVLVPVGTGDNGGA